MLAEAILLLVSLAAYRLLSSRLSKKQPLRCLPGPPSRSLLLGNLIELFAYKAGEVDLEWTRRYGSALRFKGLFGTGSSFQTRRWALMAASGSDHKHHRKILSPAFGAAEMKALMPVFRNVVRQMNDKWQELVSQGPATINVCEWFSRATLDIIGEAAFDYHFETLKDDSNRLARVYNNFLVSAFGIPNPRSILTQQILAFLPQIFFYLLDKLPSHTLKPLRDVAKEGRITGNAMLEQRKNNNARGSGKDVLSLLIQANESEVPSNKLSNEELISEIRTIMAAGHETTSNTILFLFYELARHPEIQEKVRNEIFDTLREVRVNGKVDLSMGDMEKMHFGLAFMKEVLRLYPAVYQTWLQSAKQDIIPLSRPILCDNGKTIHEITIEQGQNVHLSIFAYNSREDIFGSEPDDLIPERWLNPAQPISSHFGVYSNLGTFISGSQACLGYRFATIELQIFMVEVLRQFRITIAPETGKIIPAAAGVLAPVVEGEIEKGKQLPLLISLM